MATIRALLDDSIFRFESRECVVDASAATAAGRADLSDHLIGLRSRELGAATAYTFDRALKPDPRFSLL